MTPERFHQVKAVVHQALERPVSARSAFLDDACGDDADFRKQVASLLSATEGMMNADFLEKPAALLSNLMPPRDDADEPILMTQLVAALGEGYRVDRELGGGGMSRLFLAFEHALQRHVVVKVLSPDRAQRLSAERFEREVLLAAQLQHPNIVTVLTIGEVGGLPFYTMPFVRGESLRQRLASGTAVSASEAFGILKDVAKALAYAHGEGVVHRDVKPENVLLSGRSAMVTDFGIAKAVRVARSSVDGALRDETLTSEGAAIGTLAYMAPEQALGDPNVGPPADIYSLGIVAYELLAGVRPFVGETSPQAMIMAHAVEVPRSLAAHRPDLPSSLVSLVMRCLAKEPTDRYADGSALLTALEAAELSLGATIDHGPQWTTRVPSVAVLPLVNLGGDPENERFSDGIAAEILNALTQMSGLRVAAQRSSFAFKGLDVDLRTIAERLGVGHVLEGTVRRNGSRVRIGLQLVSAADGLNLWSERYDRDLADIFAVQDEIAQSIAVALEQTLAIGQKGGSVIAGRRRSGRGAANTETFELYFRGRQLVEQRAEGMHEALRCFEEAARLEPDFAAAHAGIAYALVAFGIYRALRPREAFPRAREAAERALALDPTNALALVMRAHTALWFEWDFRSAEAMARRSLELAPGLFLAHDCLGLVLAAQGRFEEAITSLHRACTLDPLSEYATYDLAWILILAGRWEEAIRALEPAVARHPKASELHRAFGFCLLYANRAQEARAEFARVLELSVGDRWGTPNLVQTLVALGEIDEARRLVAEIEQRAPHEPIPQVAIATAHHWLGNNDLALAWLERAIEARDYWLVMLRFDPSMKGLRGDPRFESLMKRVNAESLS